MPFGSWLPDELAHAGAEHLDPDFAEGYDRKQGSAAETAAVEDVEVLSAHGVGADATVVDLGAGTGRFAVSLAPRVRRVVAVDVSPAMLEVLRGRAAGHGNIEVVEAGLLTYEHRGQPAAAVHSRNVLHQLPDVWKALALRRMFHMLRPGGVLRLRDLVYDFAPADADEVIEAWLDNAATDPASGYTREDLSAHVRGEHSTFSWLLEPMLEQAGFDIVEVSSARTYGAYTCLRR